MSRVSLDQLGKGQGERTQGQGQCLLLAGPGGPLIVGAEAICFAVCIGLRISFGYVMFVSNFVARMMRRLAREPEETLATGVTLAGLGTRQEGQTRGLPPNHVGDATCGHL